MAREGILTESGTNEVELLEFLLGTQSFAINVAKIQAVIQFEQDKVTALPEAPPAVIGTYLYRDQTIPLIDLNKELDRTAGDESERKIVLITEFNQSRNAFLVDGVNRIHRISWDDLMPLSPMLAQAGARMTGSVHIDDREILVVDMEFIIAQLFPETNILHQPEAVSAEHREEAVVWLAEDSSTTAMMITEVLQKSGYTKVRRFQDGQAAWDELVKSDALPHALISDIEMPRLDGLTLCKMIKETPKTKEVPVIMFSSLITDHMKIKCKDMGANACISKPEITALVELLDKHCLNR
ncbi:MAG: chemotaxis protein CheW [Planctomycetota bacterium]|jgi:two-component system chemotaxis response regulator CheV